MPSGAQPAPQISSPRGDEGLVVESPRGLSTSHVGSPSDSLLAAEAWPVHRSMLGRPYMGPQPTGQGDLTGMPGPDKKDARHATTSADQLAMLGQEEAAQFGCGSAGEAQLSPLLRDALGNSAQQQQLHPGSSRSGLLPGRRQSLLSTQTSGHSQLSQATQYTRGNSKLFQTSGINGGQDAPQHQQQHCPTPSCEQQQASAVTPSALCPPPGPASAIHQLHKVVKRLRQHEVRKVQSFTVPQSSSDAALARIMAANSSRRASLESTSPLGGSGTLSPRGSSCSSPVRIHGGSFQPSRQDSEERLANSAAASSHPPPPDWSSSVGRSRRGIEGSSGPALSLLPPPPIRLLASSSHATHTPSSNGQAFAPLAADNGLIIGSRPDEASRWSTLSQYNIATGAGNLTSSPPGQSSFSGIHHHLSGLSVPTSSAGPRRSEGHNQSVSSIPRQLSNISLVSTCSDGGTMGWEHHESDGGNEILYNLTG